MPKRFEDTDKYKKSFIRSLPGAYKLLWDYLCLNCDHAGIWQVDFEVAQIYLGKDMPITKDLALGYFNFGENRIIELEDGKKWFIKPFFGFQYGKYNPINRVHISVLRELSKHRNKDLIRALYGPMDMDMDKDKDKDKSKKGECEGETSALPEWVDKQAWMDFKAMRAKLRKPLTEGAIKLTIRELEKLKTAGHDPKMVLEQSVMRGWQSVFPLREDFKQHCAGNKAAPIPGKYDGIGEKA